VKPRTIFDCNVLFQAATRSNGPAATALRLVDENRIILFVSRRGLQELRLTLRHPEVQKRYPNVTDSVIREFCRHLLFRGTFIRPVPHFWDLRRDPDDAPYIDLAAHTDADFLVSCDHDLLSLMTDHSLAAKQFRRALPRLRIVRPPAFLDAISAISD
jgi:putative PIN family toxin of toxin-antitoxin system